MRRLRSTVSTMAAWCLALAALALVAHASRAQDPAPADGKPTYRPSADRFERRKIGTRFVTILRGNARLEGADLTVTGDSAFYLEDLEEILVVSNVHAVTESVSLWADSLRAYQRTDVGHAFGNVRVETREGTLGTAERGIYRKRDGWISLVENARVIDGALIVAGDSIVYDRRNQQMEVFGSVSVVDEASRSVVVGEHATFDRGRGVAVVDSLPKLTSRRRGSETSTVTSRWMSFHREGEWSEAVGDVDFRQGPTQAHSDTARFYGEDLLVLSGTPQVEQHRRIMAGDEIRIRYEDQKLRQIDVAGQASLVDSTPDTLAQEFTSIPLANVLSGDSLRVFLTAGEITRTVVEGNAESVFLPEDQTSTISVNEVSGHRIDIRFEQGLVDRVMVEEGVEGSYRFLERRALASASAAADSILAAAAADSLPAGPSPPPDLLAAAAGDSLAPGGGVADSTAGRVDFGSSADVVAYSGDRANFQVQDGRIHISGNAKVEHGTLGLMSGEIYFDTEARELLAEDDPLLVDKDSELVGERMGYLFDPQTGAVAGGATKFQDGYYTGEHVRRVDKSTLLVRDGTYTSCELAEPHYHFAARRMKLKIGERVVARQVTFKVSDIPILPIPFFYKSLDSGRHSGILFPNINLGVSSREGRYIRDLGYYWATNDYTDFTFELDYNERNDATFTVRNRYNVRYGMSGGFNLDYLRRFSETREGDEWKFSANHRQPELFDVWNAQASVRLSSSNITTNNLSGDNRVDLLDTQLHSTGSVARTFENGMSLNLSVVHDQFVNAEDDDPLTNNTLYRQTLPRFSLGVKTRPLLGPLARGRGGNVFANVLRAMQFSQGYSGDVLRESKENSLEEQATVSGRFGLAFAPKGRLGPFVFTSSANFSEGYVYRQVTEDVYDSRRSIDLADSTTNEVVFLADHIETSSGETRPSLSFSNSLRTDLYGIFDTHLGPVRGIKHKISYSMSHSYRPELGSKQMSSQSIGLNLTNELSLKVVESGPGPDVEGAPSPPDSSEIDPGAEEDEPRFRKLDQLIRWSLSTSYDPDAPARRNWSDITSSVVIRPGVTQALTLDVSQTIDPYTFEIKSTRVQTGLRLQGSFVLGGGLREKEQPLNPVVARLPEAPADSAQADEEADDDYVDDYDFFGNPRNQRWLESGAQRNAMPWNVNARASITRSRNTFTGETDTRATLTTNWSLRLPGEWSINYSAGFDVETGDFTNQYYALRRNVHHWTLEFNRGFADGQDFGFRFYLRDIPDLEVKRGKRSAGDMLGRLGQF